MKYTCIELFYYAQINKEKIIHRNNKLFMETISMNWLYYGTTTTRQYVLLKSIMNSL